MANMTFSNPNGQQVTIDSPDGSTPSEQELDQMFAAKYSNSGGDNQSQNQSQPQEQTQQPDAMDTALQSGIGAYDNLNNNQPQSQQPNSVNITGDLTKGFLSSVAGTVDKVNGAAKLLNNVTQMNIGTDELSNVSNALKQMAQQTPTSSNKLISGIGQFAGSVPDALAEFAGSGGGVGFIARSAALQAAQEYNKTQSPVDLVKGAALGGSVGAILNKTPDLIEGVGKIVQKWGQTGGKTYLQAVTGATDKQADEIMANLPTMDTNPKSKVEDYGEAKQNMMSDLSKLKENNSNLIQQQKDQNTQIYNAAKSKSDDAVNNLVENNRDSIENFKALQVERKENLANSTSQDMMAATDAGVQKLADTATQTTINAANARNALDNTLVNVFGTATKKVEALEDGATKGVANAHASLENSGLDYVPTPIIAKELDNAIGSGFGKYYRNLMSQTSKEISSDFQVAPGVKFSSLGKDAQEQYLQQSNKPNLTGMARSGNTPTSLTAEAGIKNPSVMSAIKLINDTKKD